MRWQLYQQDDWDELVKQFQPGEFLQTAAWSQVEGGNCFRLWASFDDGRPAAALQMTSRKAGPFVYYLAARGPLWSKQLSVEQCQQLWLALTTQAAKLLPPAVFWRLEPVEAIIIPDYLRRVDDVQPAKTRILDLALPLAEVQTLMHAKTRYNMRLAEKKGVSVRRGDINDFDSFWSLMTETGNRDNFGIHNRQHYQRMLTEAPELIRLYLAEYQGQVLAAGLFAFWGETVSYVHGASSSQQRNVMAPYGLHWRLLQIAQQEGYKYYDLFGVDDRKWPGVSRFKAGFGGREYEYAGTFDLVLSPVYYGLYRVLKTVKSIKRYVGKIVKKV